MCSPLQTLLAGVRDLIHEEAVRDTTRSLAAAFLDERRGLGLSCPPVLPPELLDKAKHLLSERLEQVSREVQEALPMSAKGQVGYWTEVLQLNEEIFRALPAEWAQLVAAGEGAGA